jgi:hypothetical protein
VLKRINMRVHRAGMSFFANGELDRVYGEGVFVEEGAAERPSAARRVAHVLHQPHLFPNRMIPSHLTHHQRKAFSVFY